MIRFKVRSTKGYINELGLYSVVDTLNSKKGKMVFTGYGNNVDAENHAKELNELLIKIA